LDDLSQELKNHQSENDRLSNLIDHIPQIRNKAKLQVAQSQIRQKDHYDRNVTKTKSFDIGDKVLYFNVTLDQSHSGKFNPKWRGPFVINKILPHGAYKLQTIDNQILQTLLTEIF
jgi:hypothetical protein